MTDSQDTTRPAPTDQQLINVNHEFRVPLTVVLAALERLLDSESLSAASRDDVVTAHRSTLRVLKLVNTLIDFSKIDAGRARPRLEPVDLSAFVSEIAQAFAGTAEHAGLTMTVDVPDLEQDVYVDREMLEKVVLNLLSNAFKFTFAGGISVALRLTGENVEIEIRDTGAGFPLDELPNLRGRFYKLDNLKQRSHEGTGLGLALVHELTEAMGGKVRAESAVDQGSSFTISFAVEPSRRGGEQIMMPRPGRPSNATVTAFVEEAMRWVPELATTTADPAEAIGNITRLRVEQAHHIRLRPRILVVDDNADIRNLLERVLSPFYEVAKFADAHGALEQLRAGDRFDLVLAYKQLPDMSGQDLIRALRKDSKLRSIAVILTSDRSDAESGAESFDGDDYYLVRPFTREEVIGRVRQTLEVHNLRRQVDETLRQAQKMEAVGQLIGGLAHDINNLLAAIIGSIDLAERRTFDDKIGKHLSNATAAAYRGSRLMEHLLAFSQQKDSALTPIDSNDVITSMVELLHRTLGGIVGVKTDLAAGLWSTEVDPSQLEVAILNIANNARDAMPDGGDLAITTVNVAANSPMRPTALADGDAVKISIIDNGTGMDAETARRAFEPFFTTKPAGRGTGLGLSQVYSMARQIGGDVLIDTEPGRGTTVDIYLPRSHTKAEARRPASSISADVKLKQMRILVVDDDDSVRDVPVQMLQELGHDVEEADSGRKALSVLERSEEAGKPFDLMIADYAMPGMTGIELATKTRARYPKMKILFATGYADTSVLSDQNETILRKPYEIDDLILKVGNAMDAQSGPTAKVVTFRPQGR